MKQQEEKQDNSRQSLYHREFLKISSKFGRRSPHIQNATQNVSNINTNSSNNNKNNFVTKQDQVQETPYTVIKTLVARLRHIHGVEAPIVVLKTTAKKTAKQGQPAVIFDMYDQMHTLTVGCKYTLVGKFSTTMHKMELITKSFIKQTQLSEGRSIEDTAMQNMCLLTYKMSRLQHSMNSTKDDY